VLVAILKKEIQLPQSLHIILQVSISIPGRPSPRWNVIAQTFFFRAFLSSLMVKPIVEVPSAVATGRTALVSTLSMNKSLAFFGRQELIENLCVLYAQRKHVLLVGDAGIGKTALLRQVNQSCPMLLCEESSSLRRICDSLERQLGWTHYKLNVVERKNRLLAYVERRGEPVAFDQVAMIPPRVARFIGRLADHIPVWIACRSDRSKEIGRVWEHLYKFTRIELPPLTRAETSALIENAVAQGNIQADAREHTAYLHRLSKGVPRILEELLIELAARKYKIDSSFGRHLLELDRRIHEIADASAKLRQ